MSKFGGCDALNRLAIFAEGHKEIYDTLRYT
jgi:hypothetical protein